MPLSRSCLSLLAVLLMSVAIPAVASSEDTKVFGWVEKATLEPGGVEVKAKLDSGALTSSLDARDIERFEQDGEDWVSFRLRLKDEASGETFTERMTLPLYRNLRLRGAGGTDRRPVVLMNVCLGDTVYEEQFSLRDREEMNYPLLLGRRSIGHLGLLDVRETFLNEPDCDDDAPFVAHNPDEDD
ncbi:MAG: ATP-dependent zinc protease [Halomonas sp.]|uniref:retropepsin-like aspartic peptidase RloA3 n=1 Tax=Halomonas sp. TaxID=1486246 RepID=UPI002ACE7384|nr:ATP-dependent zinc protease [Halomonas sp.]MDZ7853988.1 ATP-dependent zinc protease [Halomonas sp.]